MNTEDETRVIEALVQRLVSRFPHVPPEAVSGVVEEAYGRFTDARFRDFVPLLVEHDAKERLRAGSWGAVNA